MKIRINWLDSIDQTLRSISATVEKITPEVLCGLLKKDLEDSNDEKSDTEFRCEKLEAIYHDQYYFVVHSEDMVMCKEVGFINVKS